MVLLLWPLENALSVTTGGIHGNEFPSYVAEAVCWRLTTIRLEQVFPLLRCGRRPAIRPSGGSQHDTRDDRERDPLFHSNLREEVT